MYKLLKGRCFRLVPFVVISSLFTIFWYNVVMKPYLTAQAKFVKPSTPFKDQIYLPAYKMLLNIDKDIRVYVQGKRLLCAQDLQNDHHRLIGRFNGLPDAAGLTYKTVLPFSLSASAGTQLVTYCYLLVGQ